MDNFKYQQHPDSEEIERMVLKFKGHRYHISETLYNALCEAYEACADKDGVLTPDEAKGSWTVILGELIGTVVRACWPNSPEEQRTHFADYYSCVLRGINPVSKTQIMRSKIDGDFWHFARLQAVGENFMNPII